KNTKQICEEIGRGRFDVISRCFSSRKNSSFACKIIKKSLFLDFTGCGCLDKSPIVHIHEAFTQTIIYI
ncbi:Phosphoenolpyruvate carboxylase kinase 2, partial [Linum perenne]